MPAQGTREGGVPVQAHPAGRETPAQENPFNTASSLHPSFPWVGGLSTPLEIGMTYPLL